MSTKIPIKKNMKPFKNKAGRLSTPNPYQYLRQRRIQFGSIGYHDGQGNKNK